MMRLVVIGGSGFVGSNLVKSWISGDFLNAVFDSILIIDNGSTGGHSRIEKYLSSEVVLVEADASDTSVLCGLLQPDDFIIFLAANPDISKGFTQPRLDFTTGTVTAEAVAEACRLVGIGFLFFSSHFFI
jgi:dTDP-glucose 4,6-dehydratase